MRGSLGDQVSEEGTGGRARHCGTLGMPLDGEKRQSGRRVGFDGLDDGVLRATRRDAEAGTWDSDSLVVGGVDGQALKAVTGRGFG